MRAIVTIDVEGHRGNNPIDTYMWGETVSGERHGIDEIMDSLNRHGAQGVFFVDFAESFAYGRGGIAEVCKHIEERGHVVQLHVHPNYAADPNRRLFWQYTYDEQRNILSRCCDEYKAIMGRPPLAFRAGGYSANHDTIRALRELGVPFDFSQFYGRRECVIDPPLCYVNPVHVNGITEIPVTTFRSFSFAGMERFDKIDMEMNSGEFVDVMERMSKSNHDAIVPLFFHGFSLLSNGTDLSRIGYDRKKKHRLEVALSYVESSEAIDFMRFEDVLALDVESLPAQDNISSIVSSGNCFRQTLYLYSRAYDIRKTNRKARLLICCTLVAACVLVAASLVLLMVGRHG